MNWNQIGEQIKAQRERKGLSQSDLGDRIGASKQFISKLENGKACSVNMLNKIAEALGCSLQLTFNDT